MGHFKFSLAADQKYDFKRIQNLFKYDLINFEFDSKKNNIFFAIIPIKT